MRPLSCLLVVFVAVLAGCGGNPPVVEKSPLAEKIGKFCTVQFRRGDGLGAGADLPVSPTTNGINGADVSITGKLNAVGVDWIVIANDNSEYGIPRESILLVQFDK